MRTRKSQSLLSAAGALNLLSNAMMGVAMGLAFGLLLILIHPKVGILLQQGGSSALGVLLGTVVTTFAIGAALTGAVFIMTENDDDLSQ